MPLVPSTAAAPPVGVPGPTTNLNIGMDYWGAPASSPIPALCGKVPSAPVSGGIVTAGSRDNQSQIWLQVCHSQPFFILFFSFTTSQMTFNINYFCVIHGRFSVLLHV